MIEEMKIQKQIEEKLKAER